MFDNYNNNMYLKTSDLNAIENDIETITNSIQEEIFENQSSSLRNIRVGDNLSNKTLYLSFPRDAYEDIDNTIHNEIVTVDENTRISYIHSTNNNQRYIYVRYKGKSYYLYSKNNSANDPYLNYARTKLPADFGVVDSINDTDIFYQYIKIYDNEYTMPNYNKHVWSDDEVLSMQKMDNLENGIKNIGYYYYKPVGWQTDREWLGTNKIGTTTRYGVNIQNLSYQDLNRWVNNLSLINFNNLDELTIWNSNITQLQWNKNSDIEWEEM